jgi:hypothetical protein
VSKNEAGLSRRSVGDPRTNLALIIRESGHSQAKIAELLGERGYNVSRATINRWANPEARNRTFTYNAVIMSALLDICSEKLVIKLGLSDLFSPGETLQSKLGKKGSSSLVLPRIIAKATEGLHARTWAKHFCGRYSISSLSNGTPGRRKSRLEITHGDDVTFRVRCYFESGEPSGLSPDERVQFAEGRMVFWERTAMFLIECGGDPVKVICMTMMIPDLTPPIGRMEGLMTLSAASGTGAPTSQQVAMQRVMEDIPEDAARLVDLRRQAELSCPGIAGPFAG